VQATQTNNGGLARRRKVALAAGFAMAPFAGLELAALAGAAASPGANHPRQLGFDSVAGEIEQVEVPEPATLGMLALGLAGLGLARRRRRGVCPQ